MALHPADAKEYGALAAGLVLVVGTLFLLFGLAKLGFVSQFLSRPVMDGFVFGLAIFVAVGQLNQLFGLVAVAMAQVTVLALTPSWRFRGADRSAG